MLCNRVYRRSDREILEFGRRLFSFQLQPSRLIFKEDIGARCLDEIGLNRDEGICQFS